jgi:uncharacterized coiled-coil protein SlyX
MEEEEILRQELLDMRADYTVAKLAVLTETMSELFQSLQKSNSEKLVGNTAFYDAIKATVLETIKGLTEVSKAVDLQPLITPMLAIAKDISTQNSAISSMMVQLAATQKDDSKYQDLLRDVLSMVEKTGTFTTESMKVFDYTEPLRAITTALNNRPTKWEFDIVNDRKIIATAK